LDGAKTEFEPYRWGALLAFQRMDGVRRLADRAAPPHRQDSACLCRSHLPLVARGCRSAVKYIVFRRFRAWHRFC
jgi:hypothetical protein